MPGEADVSEPEGTEAAEIIAALPKKVKQYEGRSVYYNAWSGKGEDD